jgi:hypothetical protein
MNAWSLCEPHPSCGLQTQYSLHSRCLSASLERSRGRGSTLAVWVEMVAGMVGCWCFERSSHIKGTLARASSLDVRIITTTTNRAKYDFSRMGSIMRSTRSPSSTRTIMPTPQLSIVGVGAPPGGKPGGGLIRSVRRRRPMRAATEIALCEDHSSCKGPLTTIRP